MLILATIVAPAFIIPLVNLSVIFLAKFFNASSIASFPTFFLADFKTSINLFTTVLSDKNSLINLVIFSTTSAAFPVSFPPLDPAEEAASVAASTISSPLFLSLLNALDVFLCNFDVS